jgi:hypothetical protein
MEVSSRFRLACRSEVRKRGVQCRREIRGKVGKCDLKRVT